MGWERVDWIYLVKNRDQWQDLVDIVTNLPAPYDAGNFLTN
jgi:hypothetical protein